MIDKPGTRMDKNPPSSSFQLRMHCFRLICRIPESLFDVKETACHVLYHSYSVCQTTCQESTQ